MGRVFKRGLGCVVWERLSKVFILGVRNFCFGLLIISFFSLFQFVVFQFVGFLFNIVRWFEVVVCWGYLIFFELALFRKFVVWLGISLKMSLEEYVCLEITLYFSVIVGFVFLRYKLLYVFSVVFCSVKINLQVLWFFNYGVVFEFGCFNVVKCCSYSYIGQSVFVFFQVQFVFGFFIVVTDFRVLESGYVVGV